MSTTLRLVIAVVTTIAGIITLAMGERSPLEGEGLFGQFLSKRLAGLLSLAIGVIFFASLASATGRQLSHDIIKLDETQHGWQDYLSAVGGIPFTAGAAVLGVAWAVGEARDRSPIMAVIALLFSLFAVFSFLFCTAYLRLTDDPLTILRSL